MELRSILEATHIELVDHWYGMHPLAPFDTNAELELGDGGAMSGSVTFSIGYGAGMHSESQDVSLTGRQTKSLLEALAEVSAVAGKYEPLIEHTDDMPSISIVLSTPIGQIKFFTESQGKYHAPWGVMVGEDTFVVDSPVPGKVLHRLRRLLGAKRLNEMVKEAG